MTSSKKKKIYFYGFILVFLIILFIVISFSYFITYQNVNITTTKSKPQIPINDENNPPKEDNQEPERSEYEITANLRNQEYYLERNYQRYLDYAQKYPQKSYKDVVTEVNCNIDKEFYTNTEASNLETGTLILVNKFYTLNNNYVPELVEMDSQYSHASTKKMHPEAYDNLVKMINAALLDNIILYDVSSYRSYQTQDTLYNNYVKRDGASAADRYSARPGSSEHQTGLATDLNTASSKAHFENSKEFAWLNNNAHKFGFILRYPKDKEYLTGYKFEPWHYRYVGVEVATYIKEHDITYEEYYAYFIVSK